MEANSGRRRLWMGIISHAIHDRLFVVSAADIPLVIAGSSFFLPLLIDAFKNAGVYFFCVVFILN